jgi:hypothetical protein
MKRLLFVLLALVVFAPVASAQTVIVNPTGVEFTPSADHAILGLDGTPKVVSYELRLYLETGTVPVKAVNLGKPVPVANLISITNVAMFAGIANDVKHIARVVALGSSGEGVSLPTGPFGNAAPPAAPLAPTVKK